jgi:hypothetical protein
MTNPLPKGPQSVSERPALVNIDCKREMIIAAAAEIGDTHHGELRQDIFDLDNVRCEPRSIPAGSVQLHKFIRVALT